MLRRFHLQRDVDEGGVSGTGIVAEGVVFESGRVALSWLTKHTSLGIYDNIDVMETIHGHGGKTRVVWDDIPGTREVTPPRKVRESEDDCG